MRVTIRADRTHSAPVRHIGEEWLYVQRGSIDLEYDGTVYELAKDRRRALRRQSAPPVDDPRRLCRTSAGIREKRHQARPDSPLAARRSGVSFRRPSPFRLAVPQAICAAAGLPVMTCATQSHGTAVSRGVALVAERCIRGAV